MKKYLYGFKLYFLDAFHYRFNAIINLFFGNVSTVITVIFWILIYESNEKTYINGFSLSDMITYFVISSIFRSFVFNSSGFAYSKMIKEGGLNSELLKPYDISISVYFKNLAKSITSIFPQFILFIMLLPVIAKYLTWNLNITNVFFVLAFLIISTICSHIVWSILGLMAFWLEEANAVMWSFAVFFNLISGMFIPLDFFPKWSISIIQWLPFSSWVYLPSKIYLGLLGTEKMLLLLVANIGWILLLLLLYQYVWSIGVKKYSSIGG